MFKTFIVDNKKKIELTQWAIINGIASLVYSEYLQRFKQKQYPVKKIMIPPIKYVKEFLNRDNELMISLSNNLIDDMLYNQLFQKFKNAPELAIFDSPNIELLKTVFDLYMIPNIERRIPETIMLKFGIGNESQQLFIEDSSIDLFNRNPISQSYYNFIVEESILQLLFLLPTLKKDIEIPDNNRKILMTADEILTINNENAICPIHFNSSIIENSPVNDLLKFITSTNFKVMDNNVNGIMKKDEIVKYSIDTNPFNEVLLIRLIEDENTLE